jgi:hypothetical protein
MRNSFYSHEIIVLFNFENEFSLVPPMSLIPFTSQSAQLHHPEQLWLGFPRSVYGCYSTGNILIEIKEFLFRLNKSVHSILGNLGENAIQLRLGATATNENILRTNILGPKHFIVEEENEALLAKELQEAKIQSSHNSHSSMHSSQPHLLNFESNDFCIRNPNVRNL